jgi:septum formation protein
MRLVLASASPRRRELLESLGLTPEVRPVRADESVLPGESPADYVRRLAAEKARAVAAAEGELVLAADTAVLAGGEVLGKPRDAMDAGRMLRTLSGTAHEVLTGVHARRAKPGADAEAGAVVVTQVRFTTLTEAQIAWYVGTGEPLDKAGAYAIQGRGGAFVRSIRGSASNVVGLPLEETLALLARLGFRLPWEPP